MGAYAQEHVFEYILDSEEMDVSIYQSIKLWLISYVNMKISFTDMSQSLANLFNISLIIHQMLEAKLCPWVITNGRV